MSGNPSIFTGESGHRWPGLSLRAARFGLSPWRRALTAVVALLVIFAAPAGAAQNPPDRRLAAAFQLPQLPGLPSLTGPSADWRQFDAFFTFVVKRFGEDVPPALQDSLADAFLDSRYELTSAVAPGRGGNPVPQLFVDGWRRLSPIMNQALPALPNQTASSYSVYRRRG